jgi:hypothetical protein
MLLALHEQDRGIPIGPRAFERRSRRHHSCQGPSHVGRWRPDWLAGLRGFELPEDDSSNSHQLPEKGTHNVRLAAFTPFREGFQ